MRRISVTSAIVVVIIGAISTASLASPQNYCDSFAREAASRKTGHADAPAGTIGGSATATTSSGPVASDGKWRQAYDAAFGGCMSNYASRAVTAPPKAKTSVAKAVKPARKAKASSRRHRARHATVRRAAKPAPKVKEAKHAPKIRAAGDSSVKQRHTPDRGQPISLTNTSSDSPVQERRPANIAPQKPSQDPQRCRNLACLLRKPPAKQ
jgi:hypothetical protein